MVPQIMRPLHSHSLREDCHIYLLLFGLNTNINNSIAIRERLPSPQVLLSCFYVVGLFSPWKGLDGERSVQGQGRRRPRVTKELWSYLWAIEQFAGGDHSSKELFLCLLFSCMVPALKKGCIVMKNGTKEILFLEHSWPLSGGVHVEASAEEPSRPYGGQAGREGVELGWCRLFSRAIPIRESDKQAWSAKCSFCCESF